MRHNEREMEGKEGGGEGAGEGHADAARRLLFALFSRLPVFLPRPPPHTTHSQEFKPSDFDWHKTKIAQLLTVKRERTLAAGVNKRESRRAEKAEKVAAGFGQF